MDIIKMKCGVCVGKGIVQVICTYGGCNGSGQTWCNGEYYGCRGCGGDGNTTYGVPTVRGCGRVSTKCIECDGTGIKKESVLEKKVMEMRDEHEIKLTELQDTQREQLLVIHKNEEKLREIVDGHQSTIGELNKQNSKLSETNKLLLKNQQIMSEYISNASYEYSKIMMVICQKLKMLNDEELVGSIKQLMDVPKSWLLDKQ